jgi:putative Mn2+ efflux pump MntP
MIWESFRKEEEEETTCLYKIDIKEILLLSIATSIDALAAGITFAFLQVSIVKAVCLIGGITFFVVLLGVFIGNRFGIRFKNKAELVGGCI